jgi:hypothetical protein
MKTTKKNLYILCTVKRRNVLSLNKTRILTKSELLDFMKEYTIDEFRKDIEMIVRARNSNPSENSWRTNLRKFSTYIWNSVDIYYEIKDGTLTNFNDASLYQDFMITMSNELIESLENELGQWRPSK